MRPHLPLQLVSRAHALCSCQAALFIAPPTHAALFRFHGQSRAGAQGGPCPRSAWCPHGGATVASGRTPALCASVFPSAMGAVIVFHSQVHPEALTSSRVKGREWRMVPRERVVNDSRDRHRCDFHAVVGVAHSVVL